MSTQHKTWTICKHCQYLPPLLQGNDVITKTGRITIVYFMILRIFSSLTNNLLRFTNQTKNPCVIFTQWSVIVALKKPLDLGTCLARSGMVFQVPGSGSQKLMLHPQVGDLFKTLWNQLGRTKRIGWVEKLLAWTLSTKICVFPRRRIHRSVPRASSSDDC